MTTDNFPPEPHRLREQRRQLLGLCERRLGQGRARLMVCAAAVTRFEVSATHLAESQAAQFMNAVTIQIERMDTLDLELRLQEEWRTGLAQLEMTEFDPDEVMDVLVRHSEEVSDHTRLLTVSWCQLVLNQRKLQRHEAVGEEQRARQDDAAIVEHRRLFEARAGQLRGLRTSHLRELQELLGRLDSRIPLLEARVSRLNPGNGPDESRFAVLQEDMARIRALQARLQEMIQQHQEEQFRHDWAHQSARQVLMESQLDQDLLRLRINHLKQV